MAVARTPPVSAVGPGAGRELRVIGSPWPVGPDGVQLPVGIATLFPQERVLVTASGVHVTQRMAYTDSLSTQRVCRGETPLTDEEVQAVWASGVDLILDGEHVLIRPDPLRMDLAVMADELLQAHVRKSRIRFLHAADSSVHRVLRERGELWRICPAPQTPADMAAFVANTRIHIGSAVAYYYAHETGTRYLTCDACSRLGVLPDADLRTALLEIRHHARQRNRQGNREVAPFPPEINLPFEMLDGLTAETPADTLRSVYQAFREAFRSAVAPALSEDAPEQAAWRNRMFHCLARADDTTTPFAFDELSPEFHLQITWLPGGRFEAGELIPDPVFDEAEQHPEDTKLQALCDEHVRGFFQNLVREFGDLAYINIGLVSPALRQREAAPNGHRAYLAVVGKTGEPHPIIRVLRLQKWGIRERLDIDGMDLLGAILATEEYTEYILDRRLACRQVGMNLPDQILVQRMHTTYRGRRQEFAGSPIWLNYFERSYVPGMATDKIPAFRLRDARFALALAKLLGDAAAPNLVVGRATMADCEVIFDDGDEILELDAEGMPIRLTVADHAGTFTDVETSLAERLPAYAGPVLRRAAHVPDAIAFADTYVGAFVAHFTRLQSDYRRRRRAFDSLFAHGRQEHGTLPWRWRRVLKRIDAADPQALGAVLRTAIVDGLCEQRPAADDA